MKTMKYITVIAIGLFIAGCSSNGSEDTVNNEQEEEMAEVTTAVSESTNDSIISCTGTISVPPESIISLFTPVQGFVRTIKVIDGEKVRKGELLATIEHMDIISLQEKYLSSKANYELAQKEYDRKKELHDKDVISDKEYDQSKAAFEQAVASYMSLKRQIELTGLSLTNLDKGNISPTISVRSPIDGYVTAIHVNKGSLTGQNSDLFELVDNSHKHLHLKVFSDDIARVKEGQLIRFKTAGSDSTYIAEVFRIGKKVNPTDNSIDVHGHLKNEGEGLIIGTYVFAEIITK